METSSTLLIRVRDTGDAASWREFVAIYEPLLVAYARRKGVDGPAAPDVAQEVFVRLLKALPTFRLDRGRARFRTWLWQVTHSVIVDGARRNGRRLEAERQWRDGRPAAAEAEEWDTLVRRRVLEHALRKVGAGVKPVHWACFAQHVLGRRPAAAVAAELGTGTNVVYVNASRVLAKVRAACSEAMGGLADEADDLPG
jgi:RNA polymerase sigma-70 factor (ECF subfamily)